MAEARREVVWAPAALAHLNQATSHVAQDSLLAARRLVRRAVERSESLETMAERGRIVPEVGDRSLREIFVPPYRLIYAAADRRVHVVAFIHGARDFAEGSASSETDR